MSEKILVNGLRRSLQVQRMMGSLQIVPEEVFDKPKIESTRVEEFGGVKIHVLFLNRAVEAFGMGIHLWGLRKGVPVDLVKASNFGIKVFHELASIVGEDTGQGEGEENRHKVKKLFCCLARMARRGPRKGPAGIEIGKGDDVATGSMNDRLNGVEGSTVARIRRREMFGFSDFFCSRPLNNLPMVANLHRHHAKASEVSDEIANRGGGWAQEMACGTERLKGFVDFLLSEVGMLGALAFDLGNDVL